MWSGDQPLPPLSSLLLIYSLITEHTTHLSDRPMDLQALSLTTPGFHNDVVIDVQKGVRQVYTISQKHFSATHENVMGHQE